MPADDLPGPLESSASNIITYVYDREGRIGTVSDSVPRATCDHDREKRLFRVTEPDGTTVAFHDRAVRFLVAEPDPETGELRPVMERGRPKVIYLCREAGL
jgi:hypothetical protein